MSIVFRCPNPSCRREIIEFDHKAGHQIRCRGCGNMARVPAPQDEIAPKKRKAARGIARPRARKLPVQQRLYPHNDDAHYYPAAPPKKKEMSTLHLVLLLVHWPLLLILGPIWLIIRLFRSQRGRRDW